MYAFNFRFFGITKICFSNTGITGAHVPKGLLDILVSKNSYVYYITQA
jgi:hypothetical protein